ncbi:MAG: GntR family transcriptional regulator [Lachnospiraceae bacterium]|nr:GntR family transcriptional regulator [Lachnospiraceae bacterium]
MSTSNHNFKNQAYMIIKERLINCIYEPGSFLNEAQLAADLGCSRTPVREAISRLEFDNLVTVVPKKGIHVSDISLTDVQQIFQARLEIEPVALRMAAHNLPHAELLSFRDKFSESLPHIRDSYRLDTAMHLFIIEHCGNRYMIDMMQRVFEDNTRVIISSKQNQIQIHDARLEHLDIIDALIAQDTDKAVQLMKSHIESCRRAALDYFYDIQAYSAVPSSSSYKAVLDKIESI